MRILRMKYIRKKAVNRFNTIKHHKILGYVTIHFTLKYANDSPNIRQNILSSMLTYLNTLFFLIYIV